MCSQRGETLIISPSPLSSLSKLVSLIFCNLDDEFAPLFNEAGPNIGGPSIIPNEPLLHIRCSNREAARSEASVASISDRADAIPSGDGRCTIVSLQLLLVLWSIRLLRGIALQMQQRGMLFCFCCWLLCYFASAKVHKICVVIRNDTTPSTCNKKLSPSKDFNDNDGRRAVAISLGVAFQMRSNNICNSC